MEAPLRRKLENEKNRKFIITVTVVYLLLLLTLVVNYFIYQKLNVLAVSIVLFSLAVTIATYYYFSINHRQITGDIETNLSSSMTEALKLSRIGILVYNEDYEITWLSSLFNEKILIMLVIRFLFGCLNLETY